MKHLLNTLYVTTQGAYLAREGETAVVRVEGETKLQLPIHTLGNIVCFGQVSMSPALMGLCAERGVGVAFLTERGRFIARIQGPVSGNVLLRREQYSRADDETASAEIARSVVIAKIANCRAVLLRAARNRPDDSASAEVARAAENLVEHIKALENETVLDTIRGKEGDAARQYFSVFDHLITAQKDSFFFKERSRRPPLDNMNALLSFLYTLLVHDVSSALEGVGLDPAVGYLHRDRPGRPSLALDLMEELRPYFADRLALNLINLQQVKGKGFRRTETGAVERKQEEIQHPFLGEKIAIGLLPHCQALLMARYLRGDLDGYPPFLWR